MNNDNTICSFSLRELVEVETSRASGIFQTLAPKL